MLLRSHHSRTGTVSYGSLISGDFLCFFALIFPWSRGIDNSNGLSLHLCWQDTVYCTVRYGTALHCTGWTGLDWKVQCGTVQYDRTRKLPTLSLSFFSFSFFSFPSLSPSSHPCHTLPYPSATLLSFIPIYSILFFSSSPSSPFHSHQSVRQPTNRLRIIRRQTDRQLASKQATFHY